MLLKAYVIIYIQVCLALIFRAFSKKIFLIFCFQVRAVKDCGTAKYPSIEEEETLHIF